MVASIPRRGLKGNSGSPVARESGWDHPAVREPSRTKRGVMHCSTEDEIFRLISTCFESQGMTQEGPGHHQGSFAIRSLWMTAYTLHRSLTLRALGAWFSPGISASYASGSTRGPGHRTRVTGHSLQRDQYCEYQTMLCDKLSDKSFGHGLRGSNSAPDMVGCLPRGIFPRALSDFICPAICLRCLFAGNSSWGRQSWLLLF